MNKYGKLFLRKFFKIALCGSAFLCSLTATSFKLSAKDQPNDTTTTPPAEAVGEVLRKIHGTITDNYGNPLVGASVIVKGQPLANATITEIDGSFTISVPENATLLVSYIGFKDLRVPVRNRDKINISLTEDTELLKDVVVVGYGTERKSDLTGSIASVSSEDIKYILYIF